MSRVDHPGAVLAYQPPAAWDGGGVFRKNTHVEYLHILHASTHDYGDIKNQNDG